jgi:tRNA (guanosine-2'-O-)-methyltransferase
MNSQENCPEGSISTILSGLVSKKRKMRIEEVLNARTRYVTVVLDDLYHCHNMSAVVRSCEAFGIQDIHAIEIENRFDPSHGVALGAEQWITIRRHKSIDGCMALLRDRHYRIYAADPPGRADSDGVKAVFAIYDLPMDEGPIAIAFGRELNGLDPALRELCDGLVYIPIPGFTKSLNVSVTVAVFLYELRKRLDLMDQSIWGLSHAEKCELRDIWYLRSVKHGPKVLEEMLKRQGA